MATAAELLATSDVISIDVVSRTINIPKNLTLLGVVSDEDVQKLRFTMSRYYNNIDLSTYTIRINYENAQGEGDVYGATDIKVTSDTITFTWVVSRHATMYKGNVKFIVCLIKTDSESNRIGEFNTAIASLPVLEGLETDQAEVYAYPDIVDTVATETLAKAKENGDFTPVKGTDYYTPEEAAEFGNLVVDNANGQFANSIKGSVEGEVVRVDDVSPIEHVVDCRVHGKNFANLNNILRMVSAEISYTEPELTIQKTNDVEKWTNVYIGLGNYADFIGKTLTLSVDNLNEYAWSMLLAGTTSTGELVKEVGGSSVKIGHTTFTVTIPYIGGAELLAIRIVSGDNAVTTGEEYVLKNIQVEEGSIATEYEPYTDPSTVTVTAYGKNIVNVTGVTTTQDGVTFKVNSDGSITVNGTAEVNTFYKAAKVNLAKCGRYYLSGSPANSGVQTSLLYLHDVASYEDVYDYGTGRAFTPTGGTCDVVIAVYKGFTANNLVFYPMIEAGTVKTKFEKFEKKTTYTPTTDGKCSVVSVSPTMTLVSDTAGVVVEAEYSRDTTKMFESYVLTDEAKSAIAAEIEDDMADVLEALNSYAASLIGGDG